MAIGTTIDGLNAVTSLTTNDEVAVWDKEASGEPTKKITAQNLAASVKSLASLPNTTEMNNAIQQSTALVPLVDGTITTEQHTFTLTDGRHLSDYKSLYLLAFDGNIACGVQVIPKDLFVAGNSISVNGYALSNYHGVCMCSYVSNTTVTMYARELVGWGSIRCILYGTK